MPPAPAPWVFHSVCVCVCVYTPVGLKHQRPSCSPDSIAFLIFGSHVPPFSVKQTPENKAGDRTGKRTWNKPKRAGHADHSTGTDTVHRKMQRAKQHTARHRERETYDLGHPTVPAPQLSHILTWATALPHSGNIIARGL